MVYSSSEYMRNSLSILTNKKDKYKYKDKDKDSRFKDKDSNENIVFSNFSTNFI